MKKLILLFVLLLGVSINSMAQNENCTMLFEYYNAQDDRAGKLLDVLQQEKKDEMSILNEKVKEIKKNRKNNLLLGVAAGVAGAAVVVGAAIAGSKDNDNSTTTNLSTNNTDNDGTTIIQQNNTVIQDNKTVITR